MGQSTKWRVFNSSILFFCSELLFFLFKVPNVTRSGAKFATMCVAMYAEGSVLFGPAPLCVVLFAIWFVTGSRSSPADKTRFFSRLPTVSGLDDNHTGQLSFYACN